MIIDVLPSKLNTFLVLWFDIIKSEAFVSL